MRFSLQRLFLSVLIVLHLTAILFVPNGDFLLGKWSEAWLEPYVAFFEISSRWSYFAPDPGQPIFIDWEISGKDGNVLENGHWPDLNAGYFFRERMNRRVSTVEFMLPDETRVEKMMVPMLCRRNPAASSVRLWRVQYTLPPRDQVLKGARRIGDEVDITKKLVSRSFCDFERL